MTRKAEPREIDFSRVQRTYDREQRKVTREQEAANQVAYQAILTALRSDRQPAKRRPVVDVTSVDAAVLRHLRKVAQGIKQRWGYKSQFVELTQPVHTRLGNDPQAVLDHVWHEVWSAPKKDDLPEDRAVNRKTSWTLDELWDTEFPDLQFLVDSLIPQGLSLLVAAPKVGKSYWLATLIVCLLWDIPPFGKQELKSYGCDVLLITPDDPSARRLKNRILSIAKDLGLKREDRKYDLFIEEEWASIEDGGAEDLDAWVREHAGCKAVFIDTLDRLRDGGGTNWQKADEHAMAALKLVADAHRISIVGTHHDRKNKDTDDVLDVVSGGRKITGGVDAILVVTRPRNSPYAKLQLIGRDVEDVEYHMAFDYPLWTLGAKVGDGDATPTQRTRKDEVLDVLREDGGAMTAEAVHNVLKSAGTNMSPENVRATLSRLKDDVKVVRVSGVDGRKGGYRAL